MSGIFMWPYQAERFAREAPVAQHQKNEECEYPASASSRIGACTPYQRLDEAGIGLVAMKVMAPASRAFGFKTGGEPSNRPGSPLAALKWALRNKRFGTTVPSMTDADQLEENFRAMSEPFGAQEAELLAGINENIRPLYCRMCYRCTGQCPQGAAIPDTIRFLSYADFYGQFTLGREHFAALPVETRAIRCGECESCTVQCPNGVNILERMTRAQELFA